MKEQKIIHVHCEAAMVKITRLTRAKFPVELKCQLNQKEKIQVLFNQRLLLCFKLGNKLGSARSLLICWKSSGNPSNISTLEDKH